MAFTNLITQYDYYIYQAFTFLFNYISAYYLFYKANNWKLRRNNILFLAVSGLLSAIIFVAIKEYNRTFAQLFSVALILVLLVIPIRKKDVNTLGFALICVSVSHVIRLLSAIILTTMVWTFGLYPQNLIAGLFHGIVQVFLSILIMSIKRFKNGISVFCNQEYLGLGIAISGIILLIIGNDGVSIQNEDVIFIPFIIGIIIAGFGLYLWIRRSITAHYRERLQLKFEEHYKELLEQSKKEIEKLNQSNEYLAKIVHRDNHLMGALDSSINAYLNSTDETEKDNLLREIQTLAKERGELIAKEQLESKLLPTTGNLLIDSAINDLYIKAAAHGIDFNLTVSSTVDEIIGKYISQTDLQALLSDHIKDAIIAVDSRGEAGGKILVNLSMQNDNYCIDIYDNGVEFSVDTLSKLGLERVTTHADTGGSGIGFMTTFETLRKAYASLIITEFENKTPFTKSVSFRFDGESAFIIHSYRSEELKKVIDRNDIMIR